MEAPPGDADLARMLDEAKRAWPEIELDRERFARHLVERSGGGAIDPSLHASDLYLACACGHGVPAALQAFAARYLSRVGAFVAQVVDSERLADEVRQLLEQRLLVGEAGRPGRIHEYQGRGTLEGWVRAVAVRTALNLERAEQRQRRARHKAAAEARLHGGDPEMEYFKRRYGPSLDEALRGALAALPVRERMLLRLHFVERVGVGRLAQSYDVHRATMGRWLLGAQRLLLDETRRRFREILKLSSSECESLFNLLRSWVDMSMSVLM